ncbi:MAG TPA: 4-hydroxythreonine-4-phosphate dehydrogenase PdxA [Bauldia sp.]|nr:4-hydroxythreonine-4-phosphate dehydrogenase PdxA [Bauldia sp.]
MQPLPPLALTMGEPGGVGPDLTLAVWRDRVRLGVPPFYLLADPTFIAARARDLGLSDRIVAVAPEEVPSTFDDALPVVPLQASVSATAGRADPANATAVVEAIARGVGDVRSGAAAALVTNPISKQSLYAAGFRHPGHTEFLGTLSAAWTGRPARPVMMLVGPELRAVPVTIHVPLRAVAELLTEEMIVGTARIVEGDLRRRFGVAHPRLAVAGLNPHAGEGGALGLEDRTVITPAIAALRAEGIDVIGPLSADAMFHPAARAEYDAAICMYHDQALIPAKTLAFSETVNVTLGLAFVRTSPDHGTAFDLAGTGRGDPSSLAAALRLAAVLVSNERSA